jgi:hypothetical protein
MPNCFTLTRKGSIEPNTLVAIDIELCKLLGRPVDARRYVVNWFDSIGLGLALGRDWGELRKMEYQFLWERFHSDDDYSEGWQLGIIRSSQDILKCIAYLEANYTPSAWYEVKSR